MTCLKLCSWGPPYYWVPESRLFKQSFFCKNNPLISTLDMLWEKGWTLGGLKLSFSCESFVALLFAIGRIAALGAKTIRPPIALCYLPLKAVCYYPM